MLFAALEAAGLSARRIPPAVDLIVDYVNGYVLAEASGTPGGPGADVAFTAELAALPPEDVAIQRRVLAARGNRQDEDSFAFGLDVILAGLESLLVEPRQSARTARRRQS